jgi:hypothetical protein
MSVWDSIRRAIGVERMQRPARPPVTEALAAPVERLLRPLGFQPTRAEVSRDLYVACAWATSDVVVVVSFEPREYGGEVLIGRNLPREAWGEFPNRLGRPVPWAGELQPYWSFVHSDEILRARGATARIIPWQRWAGNRPADISRWAEQAALDLADLSDLLQGEHLDELDALIEARPRRGVPGVDFKV